MMEGFLYDRRGQPLQLLGVHDFLLDVKPDAVHMKGRQIEGVKTIDAVEFVQLEVTA